MIGGPTIMMSDGEMKRIFHVECAMASGMIGPGMMFGGGAGDG